MHKLRNTRAHGVERIATKSNTYSGAAKHCNRSMTRMQNYRNVLPRVWTGTFGPTDIAGTVETDSDNIHDEMTAEGKIARQALAHDEGPDAKLEHEMPRKLTQDDRAIETTQILSPTPRSWDRKHTHRMRPRQVCHSRHGDADGWHARLYYQVFGHAPSAIGA